MFDIKGCVPQNTSQEYFEEAIPEFQEHGEAGLGADADEGDPGADADGGDPGADADGGDLPPWTWTVMANFIGPAWQ